MDKVRVDEVWQKTGTAPRSPDEVAEFRRKIEEEKAKRDAEAAERHARAAAEAAAKGDPVTHAYASESKD
jgi:hypothetical protein